MCMYISRPRYTCTYQPTYVPMWWHSALMFPAVISPSLVWVVVKWVGWRTTFPLPFGRGLPWTSPGGSCPMTGLPCTTVPPLVSGTTTAFMGESWRGGESFLLHHMADMMTVRSAGGTGGVALQEIVCVCACVHATVRQRGGCVAIRTLHA